MTHVLLYLHPKVRGYSDRYLPVLIDDFMIERKRYTGHADGTYWVPVWTDGGLKSGWNISGQERFWKFQR